MGLAAMNIAFDATAFPLALSWGFPKQSWELLWRDLFGEKPGKSVAMLLCEEAFFVG